MTTLPNMGLVLPTRGAPGSGAWGDTIDANLAREDAHDHTTGKGLAIPSGGLNINADIPFSSLYAPTQLHRVQFSSVTALSDGAQNKSIFVSSSDNELYWRSNAGNNVKLTSGSALNVASFAGGIGGDYVSVGATEAFDDTNKRYTFKDGSGNWARTASGEKRVYPTGGTGTFYAGIAVNGSIAASYTMTLPTALPGSTSVVQIDSSGTTTFTNTVVNDVTMASNKNVTVSGTGAFKHGTRTLMIHGSAFEHDSASSGGVITYGITNNNATPTNSIAPIPLHVGDRITAVRFFISDSATGPTKLVGTLWSISSAGSPSTLGTSAQSSGSGTTQMIAMTSLTVTLAASTGYVLSVNPVSGTALGDIMFVEVDYDRP